ncbi:MAG: Mut7-C RNAse domain-containing protein [Candidatus Methanomethylicia archaeon]
MEGFVVDGMLGKLCRWLRMLGYDTIYLRDNSDENILSFAKNSSRILLTRDFSLYRKTRKLGLKSTYINSGFIEDQLQQLYLEYGIRLTIPYEYSRCPICNTILRMGSRIDVDGMIPENIKNSYENFWICDNCGKVYWVGSHW